MTRWSWHKAMTLAERARLSRGEMASASFSGLATERGRTRLAKWNAQPPFNNGDLFQQRLDQAGLTSDVLLSLLSDPSFQGLARLAELPAWAQEINRARSDGRGDELPKFGFDHEDTPPEVLFL